MFSHAAFKCACRTHTLAVSQTGQRHSTTHLVRCACRLEVCMHGQVERRSQLGRSLWVAGRQAQLQLVHAPSDVQRLQCEQAAILHA